MQELHVAHRAVLVGQDLGLAARLATAHVDDADLVRLVGRDAVEVLDGRLVVGRHQDGPGAAVGARPVVRLLARHVRRRQRRVVQLQKDETAPTAPPVGSDQTGSDFINSSKTRYN